MDAVMYLKERARMAEKCKIGCENCPISFKNNGFEISCTTFENNHPEKAIEIVKKWNNEHPRKTYLMDFLEKYPSAEIKEDGIPKSCAEYLGYKVSCRDCKECWSTLMEE